jgi:hypothetical protein
LPLLDTWFLSSHSSLLTKFPSLKKLAASDLFHINEQSIITRKDSTLTNHPRIATSFFRALDNHSVFMTVLFARIGWLEPPDSPNNPETVDYSPFVWALGLPSDNSVSPPNKKDELPFNQDPKVRRAQYYKTYYGSPPAHPVIIPST